MNAINDCSSRCNSVPKLLSQVDSIVKMIEKAAEINLAGDYAVQSMVHRLSRIRRLIDLRDAIRIACELCSPSRMQFAMDERSRYLRLYGVDLLKEESKAVQGLMEMLKYQDNIEFRTR